MPSQTGVRRYLLGGLTFWSMTYAIMLAPPGLVARLAGREQLVEWLGALFLLGASSTCFAALWVGRRKAAPSRLRLALFLLGLFFFIAFGEEVSWGQHIFGFEAPNTFQRHNIQRELNLHNLRPLDTFTTEGEKKTGLGLWLNSNRLFDYFMVALFLVAPSLAAYRPRLRAGLDVLGIPLVPLAFAALLLVNLGATAVAELLIVRDRYLIHLAVSEIRESNYALLCLLASLYWLRQSRAGSKQS